MALHQEQSWTLFEFIGGPRDGDLEIGPSDGPAELPASYLVRHNPIHSSTLTSWNEAAARARSLIGGTAPDGYARLIWEGDGFDAVHGSGSHLDAHIASQRQRLQLALIAGEHHEARVIASAFCAHTPPPTELIESLIAPAMREIGDRWQAGSLRIYIEQRASAIVHGILGDHAAASTQVAGQRAVVTTVGDERHSLPARMAAIALREDGWQIEELTGPVPIQELGESVAERQLDMVVISTTLLASLDAAHQVQRLLEPTGIPVLIGQPGQTLYELQRLARRVSLALDT